MNKILYFLILIISNNVFSQKNLFENLTIDKNTKIIGRYPQYDKTKTYETNIQNLNNSDPQGHV